jgi:hypothetical protein
MNQPISKHEYEKREKKFLPLWKSIVLILIFACGAVSLFGSVVYLFIRGAEQLGWPPAAHVAILVIISGIFAWVMKRISDMISEMSQRWFPEESEDSDQRI